MSSANGHSFSAFPPDVSFGLHYYREDNVQTLYRCITYKRIKLAAKVKIQIESREVSIDNNTGACFAC